MALSSLPHYPSRSRARWRRWIGVALLGLAGSATALACGPYTVSLFDVGRLHYRDANGQPAGIDHDLVPLLARRSGCTLRTELDSRVRIWQRLRNGSLDLTTGALHTPDRAEAAELWPYLRFVNHVLLRAPLAAVTPTADDFVRNRALTVVVVKGYVHGPVLDAWLARLREQGRVNEVGDFPSALRVFRAGRVDAMVSAPANLQPSDALGDVQLMPWAGADSLPLHLLAARKRVSAADRLRLQQALQSLLDDGSVAAVLRQHLTPEQARSSEWPGTGKAARPIGP
jgi:polar amino acid transport system substrate-binding protein